MQIEMEEPEGDGEAKVRVTMSEDPTDHDAKRLVSVWVGLRWDWCLVYGMAGTRSIRVEIFPSDAGSADSTKLRGSCGLK